MKSTFLTMIFLCFATVYGLAQCEICETAQSAVLTATATAGTPGYTYSWSPTGGTAATATVSPAVTTTYTVEVTDANGCTNTETFEVIVNPPPTLVCTPTDATCGDTNGQIDAVASGGTGPYTYTIIAGGTGSNTTGVFTGLAAGAYTIEVVDAKGCKAECTTTIDEAEGPEVTVDCTVIDN